MSTKLELLSYTTLANDYRKEYVAYRIETVGKLVKKVELIRTTNVETFVNIVSKVMRDA